MATTDTLHKEDAYSRIKYGQYYQSLKSLDINKDLLFLEYHWITISNFCKFIQFVEQKQTDSTNFINGQQLRLFCYFYIVCSIWMDMGKDFYQNLQIKDIIFRVFYDLRTTHIAFIRFQANRNCKSYTIQDKRFQFAHSFPISEQLYNTYLQALLQANLPIYQINSYMQTAEGLNLQNQTKFLAKKYFDIFLSSISTLNEGNLLLIALTCLRVAIKFNQLSNNFCFFTIEYCGQLSSGNYTQREFLDCELQLVKILEFKFRFTTPYDFLVIKQILPKEKKVLAFLETVIDFTITITQMRNQSAEQIFFGALLYCCKEKKATQICYEIIKATTLKWMQSVQISIIIEQKLKELLKE